MAGSGIVWESGHSPSDLATAFVRFATRVQAAILAVGQLIAAEAEAYAKTHAPWTDRTGAARQGLTGVAQELGATTVAIVLYHQAPHGIWLEIAHGAKWQIILPTLAAMYPRVMALVAQAFRSA